MLARGPINKQSMQGERAELLLLQRFYRMKFGAVCALGHLSEVGLPSLRIATVGVFAHSGPLGHGVAYNDSSFCT